MNCEDDSPDSPPAESPTQKQHRRTVQRSKSLEELSRNSSRSPKRTSLDLLAGLSLNRSRPWTRICHIRLTQLEPQQLSASVGYFVVAVRIRGQKLKYTKRSGPIHVQVDEESGRPVIPLGISFNLPYAGEHKPKEKGPRLQISLQKPYRKLRSQFKTVGISHINLMDALQIPVDDCIDLKAPLSKLEQLSHQEERIVARIGVQIQTEVAHRHNLKLHSPDASDGHASSSEEDAPQFDSDHSESELKDTTGNKLKEKAGKLLASFTESSKQWFQKFKERHSKDTDEDIIDDRAIEFFQDHDQLADMDDVSDHHSDFEPVLPSPEAQVASLYVDEDVPPPYVILADPSSYRVRRLLRWYAQMKQSLPEKHVLVLQGQDAVRTAFRSIFKRSQGLLRPLCIAVAGGDHYINHILEPYLDLMSKERRGYERKLQLYIIPLGEKRSDNHVAHWISSQDQVYQGLFFSSEWDACFERNAPVWLEAQGQRVGEIIQRYLTHATSIFNVPIGEAVVDLVVQSKDKEDPGSQNSSDAHTVPFLRDIQVLTHHAASPLPVSPNVNSMDVKASRTTNLPPLSLSESKDGKDELPVPKTSTPSLKDMKAAIQRLRERIRKEKNDGGMPLKIDYWPVETKKRKSQKKQIKSELHHFSAFRLIHPFQADAPEEKTDGSSSESPSSLYMRVLTVKNFEKQIKEKQTDTQGSSRDATKKERVDMEPIQVNKFICSSLNYESHFSVMIDGIQWTHVNFVSVSPQWTARIKHLPVAVFVSSLQDHS